MRILKSGLLLGILLVARLSGEVVVSGVVDKTKYNDSVSFTITADPDAATTTATLDGHPVAVGSSVVVTSIQYHELKVESRSAGDVVLDEKTVRFIVRDSSRNGSEDGIPVFTPYRSVNDAPSAFSGGTFRVVAPSAWPAGLPIPIAVTLRDGDDEALWLNGSVTFDGLPGARLEMRRGWGSVTAAAASAGTIQVGAKVAGLNDDPSIVIEAAPVFTEVSGTISSNTVWPSNSRIRVTGTLTIDAGAALSVGEGTVVLLDTGDGSVGSAVEIVSHGVIEVNGVEGNPVVFAPDGVEGHWGGIELPSATSRLSASHTIFTGSGEDQTWFDSHSGYSTHKPEQALFLVSGSGSGTSVGAELHLTECYAFGLAGQGMNSKTRTWIDFQRTLMQRAVSGGQLNGSKVTIDRSALIEFPDESAEFADADNDALYLTSGDLSITNTVIGYTKDDGVDSGGSGGDNPFTAEADTTPFVSVNNWYEGIFHEANSLSGTRSVSHTGCVFINCGQGIEAGYSSSATGDGPHELADGCLFTGNMVGVRWGDNYGGSYNYNGAMEVRNSFVLNSFFKDAFSGQWRTDQAAGWVYQTTELNSFGQPLFNLHDNFLSQPDAVNHPMNTTWDPVVHGGLIESFMPVPGSDVGVAISSYEGPQGNTAAFPGSFTVRLSTFSSKSVSVDWSVIGKSGAGAEELLDSGSLDFAAGEVFKLISPSVSMPESYEVIWVMLSEPVNAEVTGEAWYFKQAELGNPELIGLGASGWRCREARSELPSDWTSLSFDDSSPAATEWMACTLPAGFAVSGASYGTSLTRGPSNDITQAFYFRKKFTISDPAEVESLEFKIRRDDAAVVWLNGGASPVLVSADGSFDPPYSYDATSSGGVPNSTNSGNYLTYSIPTSALVAGENVLAVEVHQTTLNSSDLILDCELSAEFKVPLELKMSRISGQRMLYWFDTEAALEESGDLSEWEAMPGAVSPVPFLSTEETKFFRLKK